MNTELKIDEKGRICIPIEIRKMLNIKAGEKLFFQVKDDKIILRKSTSVEDFIKKSDEFGKKLNVREK
ncbi:MAG: AbrB/MazE/SpoVT family DNA-binding domain-containing protein [Promethearchaeia archaeon]